MDSGARRTRTDPIPELLIAETALHYGLGVVHVDRAYERMGSDLDWSFTDPRFLVASIASPQAPHDPSASGYSTNGGRTWTPFATIPNGSKNALSTFGFGTVAVSTPDNMVWAPSYGKRRASPRTGVRPGRTSPCPASATTAPSTTPRTTSAAASSPPTG